MICTTNSFKKTQKANDWHKYVVVEDGVLGNSLRRNHYHALVVLEKMLSPYRTPGSKANDWRKHVIIKDGASGNSLRCYPC